jgi:hypothetical protein
MMAKSIELVAKQDTTPGREGLPRSGARRILGRQKNRSSFGSIPCGIELVEWLIDSLSSRLVYIEYKRPEGQGTSVYNT